LEELGLATALPDTPPVADAVVTELPVAPDIALPAELALAGPEVPPVATPVASPEVPEVTVTATAPLPRASPPA